MSLRKIDAMHHYYGYGCGICKECPHFVDKGWGMKHYFKCRPYGESNAESTDWRAGYTACGLIDKPFPEGDRPVVERIRITRKEEAPIPGQVAISDLLGLYHDLYGADAEQEEGDGDAE